MTTTSLTIVNASAPHYARADQGRLPHAEQPRQAPQGRRLHTPKQFHDLFLPSPAAAIRCTIAGLVWSGVPLFTELPRRRVFSETRLTLRARKVGRQLPKHAGRTVALPTL
jgi:hypothetical protein